MIEHGTNLSRLISATSSHSRVFPKAVTHFVRETDRKPRMKLSKDARRAWLVTACFAGFVGISFGASYLLSLLPSPEEKCAAQCNLREMQGHMVHIYPAAMTAGMRGRGPEECKCFRSGSYNPLGR